MVALVGLPAFATATPSEALTLFAFAVVRCEVFAFRHRDRLQHEPCSEQIVLRVASTLPLFLSCRVHYLR